MKLNKDNSVTLTKGEQLAGVHPKNNDSPAVVAIKLRTAHSIDELDKILHGTDEVAKLRDQSIAHLTEANRLAIAAVAEYNAFFTNKQI